MIREFNSTWMEMERLEGRQFFAMGMCDEMAMASVEMPMELAREPMGMMLEGMSSGGSNELRLEDTSGAEKPLAEGVLVGAMMHRLTIPAAPSPVPLPYPNTGVVCERCAVFRDQVIPLESNDEVLVAFEHGDTRRPVVLAALWNG